MLQFTHGPCCSSMCGLPVLHITMMVNMMMAMTVSDSLELCCSMIGCINDELQ